MGRGKDRKAPSIPPGKLGCCESEIRKNQIIICNEHVLLG